MYTSIAGSRGASQVLWYGKEGEHKVIVLDHLGTSLDDLIDQLKFDHRETFLYASQMVYLLYKMNSHNKDTFTCSSRQFSHFMIDITSIATSNLEISWFTLIESLLPSPSSILAWHGYSAILQCIYMFLSQQIIQSLVLLHSHPSIASKAIPSHIAMT